MLTKNAKKKWNKSLNAYKGNENSYYPNNIISLRKWFDTLNTENHKFFQ